MTEEPPRDDHPHIDMVSKIRLSEGKPVTGKLPPLDPKLRYPAAYRLPDPDSRVLCPPCYYEHHEKLDERKPPPAPNEMMGSMTVVLTAQVLPAFFPNGVICNRCERPITPADAHACEPVAGIRAYVRETWESRRSGMRRMKKKDTDAIVEALVSQLVERGTYTPCPYHDDHFVVRAAAAP